jgi:hypothetical protein
VGGLVVGVVGVGVVVEVVEVVDVVVVVVVVVDVVVVGTGGLPAVLKRATSRVVIVSPAVSRMPSMTSWYGVPLTNGAVGWMVNRRVAAL